MDVRLYNLWDYYIKKYQATYPDYVKKLKSKNQGHIGIVNAATRPTSNT